MPLLLIRARRSRPVRSAGQRNTASGSKGADAGGGATSDRQGHGSDNIPGGIGCRSMRRTPFNDGWTVGAKANSFAEQIAGSGSVRSWVTLPHDAMIGMERSPSGNAATAFYPSGNWEYKKSFELSPDAAGCAIFLEFDGVYRDAQVRVNGTLVAHRPSGYADFTVQIDHLLRIGQSN